MPLTRLFYVDFELSCIQKKYLITLQFPKVFFALCLIMVLLYTIPLHNSHRPQADFQYSFYMMQRLWPLPYTYQLTENHYLI